jgi:hypothetical protein
MDGFEENPNLEDSRPAVLKYALSDGVGKAQKLMNVARNLTNNTIYIVCGVWFAVGVWTFSSGFMGIDLPRWVLNSITLSLFAFMAVSVAVIYGVVLAVRHFGYLVSSKKVKELLPGDPMVARVASDFELPETMVLEAFETMVIAYKEKSEFVHGSDLIKLKLKSKWDDVLGDYIPYLRVRRVPVSDFANSLIKL